MKILALRNFPERTLLEYLDEVNNMAISKIILNGVTQMDLTKDTAYIKVIGSWVEVSAVYKKVNGSWVLQSDLTHVFDSGTHYIYH